MPEVRRSLERLRDQRTKKASWRQVTRRVS
jgi:hypothetical protein